MTITFLMPCFMWVPSGGFRVVYEYANRLVSRGHQVTVVHPRLLKFIPPPGKLTFRERLRIVKWTLRELVSKPKIHWHNMDRRVNLLFVPTSESDQIPDADVLFATAWNTVASVLHCSRQKGEKCYFIQHYETWMGPKHLVDDTWRASLHKIVISQWLLEIGKSLGATDLTYIRNAVDHHRYRLIRPIKGRPRQVVMMCSAVPFKRCLDGIKAIEIAKKEFPELNVVLFGNGRRPAWVPDWMNFWRDPPQDCIVDDFYNNSSIVLSSSLVEGFALPPAEGAACGCAIVATDSGGIRDFVEHGVTGLLSPPKDPKALAANLCRLLRNDDLRVSLAEAGNKYSQCLDWNHSTDLFERFLFRVIDNSTIGMTLDPRAEAQQTALAATQSALPLSEAALQPKTT